MHYPISRPSTDPPPIHALALWLTGWLVGSSGPKAGERHLQKSSARAMGEEAMETMPDQYEADLKISALI